MLNISKISKMLLLSGLVLAFSCVSVNVNTVFAADDCKTAKNTLDKHISEIEKYIDKYTRDLETARKNMNKAMDNCTKKGTAIDNCKEYTTARDSVKTSEENLKAQQDLLNDEYMQTLRKAASKACAGKSDANNYKGGGKEAEKEKNTAEANKDQAYARKMEACAGKGSNTQKCRDAEAFFDSAVQEYEAAKEEYDSYYNQTSDEKTNYDTKKTELEDAKAKTEQAEKDMQQACAGGMNTEACMDAQYKYKEAQDKEKEAQDNYDDAEKDYNKEKREAEEAVREANEDIEKFCTPGSRRYNEKKCKEAKDAKDKAENNPIYKENHPDKPADNADKNKTQENKEVVVDSVDDAIKNNVSKSDLDNLKSVALEKQAELNELASERSRLEQEKNIACAKPKSKECREANAAYEQAKLNEERAQSEYKKAQSEWDNAEKTKGIVEEYMNNTCGNPKPEDSEKCTKAKQEIYQKEIDDAEKGMKDAQAKATKAQDEFDAATEAYNKALLEQTEACKKPKSKACENATKSLEDTLARKNKAGEELKLAKEKVDTYTKNKEEAEKSLNTLNEAAEKAATDAAEKEAKKAEAEAKEKRQKEADKICDEYGDESLVCKNAMERLENPKFRGYREVIKGANIERESGFNYTETDQGDVFEMVTRRAAYIIVSIKPIVYIFAGFGLIAFAWGAIFNKISWKHFANISIGLFLVANAGRLIEYMVTSGDGGNYYIGQWDSNRAKDKKNELSAGFEDTYLIYSYEFKEIPEDLNVEVSTPTTNTKTNGADTKDIKEEKKGPTDDPVQAAAETITDKDKFCQSGLGFGKGGFKDCVKDVVGAVKHVADSVKTVVSTAEHVVNRVEDIKDAANGLNVAFKQIGDAENVFDVYGGLKGILNNLDNIDGAINSAKGAIDSGVDSVVDNVTNIGDSSNIQSNSTLNILGLGLSSVEDATNSVYNATNKGKGGNSSTGEGGNTSSGGGSTGGGNSGSMDSSSSEATMTPQGEYNNAVKTEREMANEVHQKENELKQLENDYKKAADRAYEACKQDKNSDDCKLASDYARSLQDQVKDAKKDLEESEEAYYNAQEESWKKEGALLDGKQQEAEKALEDAKKVKEEACKLPDSDECKAAKKAENDARGALIEINDKVKEHDANKPSKPEPVDPFAPIPADTIQVGMAEQNQQSEGIDSKPTAQEEYQHAADDEREKANAVRQKENELKQLEREMEQAQKDKDKACADDPNSDLCKAYTDQLKELDEIVKDAESDLETAQAEYNQAQQSSYEAQGEMLYEKQQSAEKALEDAKKVKEDACKNPNSDACKEAQNNLKDANQEYIDILKEQEKHKENDPNAEPTPPTPPTPPTVTEQAQDDYQHAADDEREKANEVRQKENELKQLEGKKAQAQKDKDKACADDPNSSICEAYKEQLKNYDDLVKDAESDLETAQDEYNQAQQNSYEAEGELLKEKEKDAKGALNKAEKAKEDACKYPNSDACKEAKEKLSKANQEYIDILKEQEKHKENDPNAEPTPPTPPTPPTVTEQAQDDYQHAADDEREKANEVRQKENELKQLEREMEQAQKDKDKACADDPNSEACRLAKITLGTYEAQVKAKEDDLNKAKSEYNNATVKSKKSKINMLEKQKEETDQRMNDLIEQAQITCAGNSSSQSCIELTKQINELSQKLSGIIGELDKLKQ